MRGQGGKRARGAGGVKGEGGAWARLRRGGRHRRDQTEGAGMYDVRWATSDVTQGRDEESV